MTQASPRLKVAVIGHGFMGAAHSQAWNVAPRFFELPATPELSVMVGRDPERTGSAAKRFGWDEWSTDWLDVVTRADIDVVDICTPGDSHADIAVVALEAGKHVICEKPLANSVVQARRMAEAADRARSHDVFAMTGFAYRRVPALAFARGLIESGRIGRVRQVRANYLQDWLVDESAPMTWRLDKTRAGSGSLGDLGAHVIDLVQYLTGELVTTVSGTLDTFVTERALLESSVGLGGTASSDRGRVTVDDVAIFTGRLQGGGLAAFEATRYATGRKNALRLEVSGSEGAFAFDLERMNELQFYDGDDLPGEQGFRRILVTEPEHPYMAAWWPTGHTIGYEHLFAHEIRDFVVAIGEHRQPLPSFDDGLQVQRALDAVERSSAHESAWTQVGS